MVTVNPPSITITQAGASSGGNSACPVQGMYVWMNGKQYPYQYKVGVPYSTILPFPSDFAVYYEGGDITTGCYTIGGNPLNIITASGQSILSTDNNGNYWALLTLEDKSTGKTYQFSIIF